MTANMSSLNDHVSRFKPRTSQSLQCKRAWELWYKTLSWYEQNIGSPATLKDAHDRITAIKTLDGRSQFGVDAQPTIRLGSSGNTVSAWQKVLGLPQTGIFDTQLLEATKNYQRGKSLDPDGVVGPATWGTVGLKTKFKVPGGVIVIAGAAIGAVLGLAIPVPVLTRFVK